MRRIFGPFLAFHSLIGLVHVTAVILALSLAAFQGSRFHGDVGNIKGRAIPFPEIHYRDAVAEKGAAAGRRYVPRHQYVGRPVDRLDAAVNLRPLLAVVRSQQLELRVLSGVGRSGNSRRIAERRLDAETEGSDGSRLFEPSHDQDSAFAEPPLFSRNMTRVRH